MSHLRACSCVLLLSVVISGQSPDLTVEWIYSAAPWQIAATESCTWLSDNTILIDRPDGGTDRLDPRTEKRDEWLSARRAAEAIGEALGRNIPRVPPPTGASSDGKRAFWRSGSGRVIVVDLPTYETRVLPGAPADTLFRLSPDSSQLAFVRDHDLWSWDIGAGKAQRLTKDGSDTIKNGTLSWVYWEEVFGRQDIGYWWSPDSKSIAFLRSDESMVTEMTYMDFRPEVPRLIKQRYPKAGTTNPVVLLGIATIGEKGVTWAKTGEEPAEYIVRAKWLPTSDRVSVQTLNRNHDRLDLWFVDRATGEGAHVLTETDPGWINVHDDLYFLKNGEHFLWVSERDGWSHLYRYTMDGKLVNQVTKGEWALHGSTPIFWLRQAVAGIDETNGWVYFGALEHDPIENHLYRIRLDGTRMQRLTRWRGTHSINMSHDAAFFLDEHSNTSTPPSLTLRRAADGGIVLTLNAAKTKAVAALDCVNPELFQIENRDGFEMPGYIYKPKDLDPDGVGPDDKPKKWPVIFYTYGGPSSRSVTDGWDFDRWWNNILVRAGYVVVCVDNRSATGLSKKDENTIAGQMTGDHELADVLDVVKWIKSQAWADPDRVGIWGWSNGGMMTLLGMTRSEEFKAGISVAPVTKWSYYDTIWAETVNKRPQDNAAMYDHMDLTKRAKDLRGRLFLVHGTYDDNVHIQNTWHFVDEMLKAGKMFDLMVYPMRKHGIADAPARVHLYKRMLEFWKQHL